MEIVSKPRARLQVEPLVSTSKFDWAVVLLSFWMISGVYLDGWAHHRFALESFFSPWHAVLYSGFFAVGLLLFATFARNLARGYPWREALPAGYGLSLLGAAIFLLGGGGDMLWHQIFGIEEDLEALLSPTHLLLAIGGALISTGPLRAAMSRVSSRSPGPPAIIALSLLYAVLAFFTMYAHPLMDASRTGSSFLGQALTITSMLLQTGLIMGMMLIAIRRWKLPFGSLTLFTFLTTLLALGIHEDFEMLPVGIFTGLAADLLLQGNEATGKAPGSMRVISFLVPVVYSGTFFAMRALIGSLPWAVEMWSGAIFLSGIAGFLLSFAFFPPLEAKG